MQKRKKISVVMGGVSNEREISLQSGANAVKALESLGLYDVAPVVLDGEDISSIPADTDVAFLALHGGWGENGGIQKALDALKLPYTGPGAEASRLAMDKIATKKVLDSSGVPTAPWCVAEDAAAPALEFPVVVKPPCDGSSVGISKASGMEEYRRAVAEAVKIDGARALVEKFIPGREFTVGILPDFTALPAIEIVTPSSWYGYEEKYLSDKTQYCFQDEVAEPFPGNLQATAKAAYRALGCRGVARVDFRATPAGEVFVLELNTLPGMTSHSLVPKACAKVGISFPDLCKMSVEAAVYG